MHRSILTTAVAALVALLVAAGGATAGSLITGAKIKDGTVSGADVRNGSITSRDLARSVAPVSRARLSSIVEDVITDPASGITLTVKGQAGPEGPAGPAGAAGANGQAGAPGISGRVVRRADVTVNGDSASSAQANCEAGETALGGGGSIASDAGMTSSQPAGDDRWEVGFAGRPGTGDVAAHVYVICAHVSA